MSKPAYIVLEHLTLPERGLRFITSNHEGAEIFHDGSIVYKCVALVDTIGQAQQHLSPVIPLATGHELEAYYALDKPMCYGITKWNGYSITGKEIIEPVKQS